MCDDNGTFHTGDVSSDMREHDTIRDAILTCARKPT